MNFKISKEITAILLVLLSFTYLAFIWTDLP
jgi:hypothetical protein